MEKISFVKMSGAGNDFIVIDKNVNPTFIPGRNFIQKVCDRRNGIGADGLITIADSGKYDFNMEYFNADGSTGSLCGNGARCAIKFADLTKRLDSTSTKFMSNNVLYSGEVLDEGKIKFNFNEPQNINLELKLNAAGQQFKACFIDTGSPHVVVKINDVLKNPNDKNSFYDELKDFPVFTAGREIRYLAEFAPGGTNVNFIKISGNKVYIRTYERGVEDETLACGTGITASALISYLAEKLSPPITLVAWGGDELTVNFETDGQKINNVSLTGPAKVTFTGEFSLKQFI